MSSPARLAIFGDPVAHSLSPQLHAHFAEQHGIDLVYERLHTPPGMLPALLPPFALNGGIGGNVTLPHKQAAFALAQSHSPAAQLARSANTLRLEPDGSWYADNTDGAGLRNDLIEQLSFTLRGQRILVLGAGGAVRGILGPLLDEGPAQLMICNRTPQRAQQLVDDLRDCHPQPDALAWVTTEQLSEQSPFDGVINATSAGHSGALPNWPLNVIAADSWAYDLSYASAAQPFLDWAEQAGVAERHDGLGMFVEQGALSFGVWFGVGVDAAGARAFLLNL